jgi:hypothetical protein
MRRRGVASCAVSRSPHALQNLAGSGFEVPHDSQVRTEGVSGMAATVARRASSLCETREMLEHKRLLEEPKKWREFYGDIPCWVFTPGMLLAKEGHQEPLTIRWYVLTFGLSLRLARSSR